MDCISTDIADINFSSHETEILGEEYDVLGLEKPIKLKTRVKIAKIDNLRIFNTQTGLPYIVRNYSKVLKTIHTNDKAFAAKRRTTRAQKYHHEFENLSTLLQFYQLWCHGLFPKAKFKDCINLVRLLATHSPQLRLYRRELLDTELNKLRVAKGIIDESPPFRPAIHHLQNASIDKAEVPCVLDPTNPNLSTRLDSDQDDDWGFMNVEKSNGLIDKFNTIENGPETRFATEPSVRSASTTKEQMQQDELKMEQAETMATKL